MSSREYNVPAVEKALDILYFLKSAEHRQSSLTEISVGIGINKSSCLTTLRTLQSKRFVHFEANTRRYSLGLAFIEFAGAVTAQVNHISLSKPVIEKLAQETHLTYFLAERISRDTVIIMEKAEFREIAHVSFPIGQRRPITAGATGKIYLAFMEHAEREALLSELVQYTPATITDRAKLEAEIADASTRGYSINFGEYTIGINGVAAAVFDGQAKVVMTITAVGFPQALHAGNIQCIGEQVYDAACQVTRLLNGKFPASLATPISPLPSSQLLATV